MAIKFSEEVQKILKKAKIERNKLKHPFIGSEHLLLSILNNKNNISIKLNNHGINYNIFKKELIKSIGIGNYSNDYFIYTPLLKRILENSIIEAKELKTSEVNLNNIFLSILNEGEGVAIRILDKLGIDLDNLYDEINNQIPINNKEKKLSINDCTIDLTKKAKENELDPLFGRDKELTNLIEILLRRNKNNPLLLGEAGVGKTAIVEELARRIVNKDIPDKLKNTKILSLPMANLVSGTKYRGEFEERVTKIIKEIENNPEIILFIDEIHTLVGAGGAEGAIDASNILKPALARGKIKVIGATTINEYKDTISKDKALNRRFQGIIVKENTLNETKNILYNLKPIYEKYHNVIITNEIINNIVELSDKYIINQNNPDKSIDILDNVCTKVSLTKNKSIKKINVLEEELANIKKEKNNLIIKHKFMEATKLRYNDLKLELSLNRINSSSKKHCKKAITITDIIKVIEEKTNIPIYEDNKDLKKLNNLEKYLNNKIIGQDNVINKITLITKKRLLGLNNNLPYSILFIGKSGVGKTLLINEYSKYMNIPIIKLDMALFKESHSISKIIGSPPGYIGYNEYDSIVEKVKNNPYSIVLLDKIEKANPDVINIFLGILDDGFIQDAHGEKVNFKNTLIIMTSNININKECIGFNKNKENDEKIQNILSTEFINRINLICNFNDLTEENIRIIIKNKITQLLEHYQKYNISIKIRPSIISNIIKESNYLVYGARKINKIIEDKVDNLIIDSLLKKEKKITINNL